MSLQSLGWSSRWEESFARYRTEGLEPARIARQDRNRYLLLHPEGESPAEVTGRFRHEAATPADYPAVGDWVAVRRPEDSGTWSICAVLPRASVFSRKVAGETTVEQVLAANVDTVFVVTGLDGDFNLRRLERYVAAMWDRGAEPVLVLNKADLADSLEERIVEAESAAPGVPVVAVSAQEESGLDALDAWLAPGRTVALLGSSGVGKSTLANALLGRARQATREVSEHESRGRHTTTARELLALPGGALLIDTPGMRELQLWGEESSAAGAFPDLEALFSDCKFRDCRHDREPGCAVLAAVEDGRLAAERLGSWRKLQRELHRLAIRHDQRLRAQQANRWKVIGKAMRARPNPKA